MKTITYDLGTKTFAVLNPSNNVGSDLTFKAANSLTSDLQPAIEYERKIWIVYLILMMTMDIYTIKITISRILVIFIELI